MSPQQKLERIDQLFTAARRGTPADQQMIIAAFGDPDWTLVQAALLVAKLYPRPQWAGPILNVLDRQDKLELYSQKDGVDPMTFPEATREIWKCRWRVKQAACHALGAIAGTCGLEAIDPLAVQRLAAYATSPNAEDYQVRAAAAKALGHMRGPIADPALQVTTADPEFCTATEAKKSLGLALLNAH